MATRFQLYISPEVTRQIARLSLKVRAEIDRRLNAIVLASSNAAAATSTARPDPPLRFYAANDRVFYQVESDTRRVVVLELRKAFS